MDLGEPAAVSTTRLTRVKENIAKRRTRSGSASRIYLPHIATPPSMPMPVVCDTRLGAYSFNR